MSVVEEQGSYSQESVVLPGEEAPGLTRMTGLTRCAARHLAFCKSDLGRVRLFRGTFLVPGQFSLSTVRPFW